METPTETIERWIEKHGNARDALNVALAQIAELNEEVTALKKGKCIHCGNEPVGLDYYWRPVCADCN